MYSIAHLKTDIEHTGAYCLVNVIIIMTQFPQNSSSDNNEISEKKKKKEKK